MFWWDWRGKTTLTLPICVFLPLLRGFACPSPLPRAIAHDFSFVFVSWISFVCYGYVEDPAGRYVAEAKATEEEVLEMIGILVSPWICVLIELVGPEARDRNRSH